MTKSLLSFGRMSAHLCFVSMIVLLAGQPFARAENSAILPFFATAPEYAFGLPEDPAPPQPGQLAKPSTPVDQLTNSVSAPPLTVGEKFNYRVVQTFGLRGFLGAFVSADIAQASGTPGAWGGGVGGYFTRFASAFGGNLSRQTMAWVIESALHEDPRYFRSEDASFFARVKYSLKQVVITKSDSGHSQFAYGRVISAFAAGQLVNAWEPPSNGSVGDGLQRGVLSLGGDFAYNLGQEFIPFLRPKSIRHTP